MKRDWGDAAVSVVLLAVAWTALWFYAAARAQEEIAAWRGRERAAGRLQDCASQTISGYPFRIEVRCGAAGFELVRRVDDWPGRGPLGSYCAVFRRAAVLRPSARSGS